MAIHSGLLVTGDVGTAESEGDDLAFIVDGKRPGENDVGRQADDHSVEIDCATPVSPEEGARTQRTAGFTYDLALAVDAESFAVIAAGKGTDGLHAA